VPARNGSDKAAVETDAAERSVQQDRQLRPNTELREVKVFKAKYSVDGAWRP